ncbi:MAG: hypothetical protein K2K68_01395 [Duncaniella sp.]|nr:hypothetical protein [Duncaniella sp.]
MSSIEDVSYTEISGELQPTANADLVEYSPAQMSDIEGFSNMVAQNAEVFHHALDITTQIAEVYGESQRLSARVDMVREYSKVELAKTAAKFQLTKDLIEKTFSERKGALSSLYNVLDDAIEKGDRELIINAMHQISSVVVSSPLSDIQNFIKAFEDKDQPLLDF